MECYKWETLPWAKIESTTHSCSKLKWKIRCPLFLITCCDEWNLASTPALFSRKTKKQQILKLMIEFRIWSLMTLGFFTWNWAVSLLSILRNDSAFLRFQNEDKVLNWPKRSETRFFTSQKIIHGWRASGLVVLAG